jgi:carbon-monoxide dehydrogenase catalytic subunit
VRPSVCRRYWGLGSCVDNSRILIACAEMVKTGGLGDSIADLPVAGAAPEWMSEKAISIGHYFVASGVYTVFGVTFPIVENTKFHKHLFEGLEDQGLGKWGFTPDPYEMARMMIAHIDKSARRSASTRPRAGHPANARPGPGTGHRYGVRSGREHETLQYRHPGHLL